MNVNMIQDKKARKKAKLEKSYKEQRLLREKVERDLANFHQNQNQHVVTAVYRETTEKITTTCDGVKYSLVGGTAFRMRKKSKQYQN